MTWAILTGLMTVWVVVAAGAILLQRRSAAATLAWLLVFVFLPVVGLVLYRLLGPLRLSRKQTDLRDSRAIDAPSLAQLSLLRRLGEAGARLLSPLL